MALTWPAFLKVQKGRHYSPSHPCVPKQNKLPTVPKLTFIVIEDRLVHRGVFIFFSLWQWIYLHLNCSVWHFGIFFLKFYFYDFNQLCIIFSCIVVLHLEIQVPQSKQLGISAASTQIYWEQHFADCEEKLVLQGDVMLFITIRTCVFLSLQFHKEKSMCLFTSAPLSPILPAPVHQQVINLCQMLVLRGALLNHYTAWSDKSRCIKDIRDDL